MIEHGMNIADLLCKYGNDDEDTKVIRILGMRTFNAFGASLKLALSGYMQNSALILRDILETVFLLSLFKSNRGLIKQWRLADEKEKYRKFSPIMVRKLLDDRDGFIGKKRAERYKLFSELAGHPTMKSDLMMRPQKDGDAVIGPFMEKTSLEAVISEMGQLACQVGEILNQFFPNELKKNIPECIDFEKNKKIWIKEFYPR